LTAYRVKAARESQRDRVNAKERVCNQMSKAPSVVAKHDFQKDQFGRKKNTDEKKTRPKRQNECGSWKK